MQSATCVAKADLLDVLLLKPGGSKSSHFFEDKKKQIDCVILQAVPRRIRYSVPRLWLRVKVIAGSRCCLALKL